MTQTGIPQTAANPMLGELNRPWEEQQAAHATAMQKWRRDAVTSLDSAVLDWDNFSKGKKIDLNFAPDKGTAKRQGIIGSYLAIANDGRPVGGGDLGPQMMRDRIAMDRFNGRGVGDDAAFYGEIVKEATGRKDTKALFDQLADESAKAALVASAGESAGTFQAWREAAKASPGYKPGNDAEYFEAWQKVQAAAKESFAEFAEPLAEVWKLTKSDKGNWNAAFDAYESMDGETRSRFMGALSQVARTLPEDKRRGFFANLGKQTGRDVAKISEDVLTGMTEIADGGWNVYDDSEDPGYDKLQTDLRNFRDDLNRVQSQDFDPIKKNWGDGFMGDVEAGLYSAPGAIFTTAVAVVPYAGQVATFKMLEGAAYTQMRQRALDGGMSDDAATEFASNTASAVGALQYLPERIGLGLITRKVPMLNKALDGISDRISNRLLRGSAIGGTVLVGETLTEHVQDVIPAAVQDIASALQDDIPDVDWNKEFEGFWSKNTSTMVAILPLALFGAAGGLNRESRVRAFSEASTTQLQAFGVTAEGIAAINAAKGQSSLNAAVDLAMESRVPDSEDAKAAVAELEAEIAAQAAAVEDAQASGVMPRFTRNADGWTVYDGETNQEIGTASDTAGAMRLATAHSSAIDETNADQTAFLATILEAGEMSAQMDGEGRKTTTDIRPGQKVTATQEAAISKADEARVMAQVAARGGSSFSGVVLGKSVTEFKQKVRETVNRINAGGSVLTVFHEEAHGFFREAITSGRLTRESTIDTIRQLQASFSGKTTKDGEALSFLPDGEVSDVQLDEAVSELMEALVIQRRKDGKHVPPGMISKNLSALARMNGGAKSFKAFVDTVREFFGLAFSRAYQIKKAIREGKVKESDIDAFTNKLFGLDMQDEHDAATLETREELLAGALDTTEGIGDNPFSLGPARMADALASEAISRIKNPKQRLETMQRIAAKLGDLKRDKDELGIAFGKGYKRKAIEDPRKAASINKESAFREASRRAELEEQIQAKYGDLLNDEDLVKLKAQRAHELMSVTRADGTVDPLRGRLMSATQAASRGETFFNAKKQGDYDGSGNISRVVFGGNLTPDQAAEEMFAAGIIKAPDVDLMWQILEREQNAVARMKDHMMKAKEELKAARVQAKREAAAWKKDRMKQEKANYSPKARLLRALAMLDGIISALPIAERGRIGGYTQLAKLGTDEKRLEFLTARIAKVDAVLENYLKKEYDKLLDGLFDRAKPAKDEAGKKRVGKAGADIHALFDVLKMARDWTQVQVDAHTAGLEAAILSGDLTPAQEAHAILELNLVGLIGNWKDADSARRAGAILNATSIFEAGYAKFKLAKLFEKEDRDIRRGKLEADTGKQGLAGDRDKRTLADNGLKAGWRDSFLSMISFEQLNEYIFGRGSKEAERIVDMEREASSMKEDSIQEKMDALDELFTRLGGSQLEGAKLRHELGQKNLTVGTRTLSQLEAITATLMWRQEDGKRHMEGRKDENGNPSGKWHYDQAFVDAIEAKLSPEALEVRAHLSSEYAGEWATLNPIYVQLNGINLPFNANYSPLTVKPVQASGGQTIDPVTGSTMSGASTTPGSLRTRGQSIAEPEFRDALQTFIAHSKQMEHWKAYAPFIAEAGVMLRNRELGNAIEEKGGAEALGLLRSWMDFFTAGGTRDAAAHLAANQMLNRVSSRVSASILIGRMGVLAIQTTQLGAAIAEMPVGSFAVRFGKLMSGQLGWGAAFRSEYIQRRLNQMPVVVQQAMEGLKSSKPNRLKHHVQQLGRLIAGTDALMTAGTFAIVHDYQLKQAKSMGLTGTDADAYAMRAAERSVDRIAQPTRPGTRSYFENVSVNPATRVLWAFASESRQKLALGLWRLVSKDRSLGEKARALTVTWIVGGMIATLIRSASRDMRDDDDEETFDEKNWGLKRLTLSTLTGPLQGIPFFGDAMEAAVYGMAGEYLPEGNLFSSLPKSFEAATRVSDWGDSKPDEVIRDVENILSGAAFFNDSLSAASSISHLARDLFSIGDNIAPD